MLLTFAEIHFLLSRSGEPPIISLSEVLGLDGTPPEGLAAAGLASLLVREQCVPAGDDAIELQGEPSEIAAALHATSMGIRIAVLGIDRAQCWHLLCSDEHRLALSPIGMGLFGALSMRTDVELETQIIELVEAALLADPTAGVAMQRTTVSGDITRACNNEEIGGPDASFAPRHEAVSALVAELLNG